jgi:hypothetical protein
MCNTSFYRFRFSLSNFFGIFRFELMVRNFQNQNHGVSSWEILTFPTPYLRVQSRLQKCKGRPKHLCRLRRRLYCWKNSSKMVCEIQARQFLHEWHSALGEAMLCIWWDKDGIINYELLERNLSVTAERYCQQLRRLEEAIQQKRPGRRHGVILQHEYSRLHSENMTKAAIQELDW